MYYPIAQKFEGISRTLAAIFFISISLVTIQSTIFADTLDQEAENYRSQGYTEQHQGNFDKALMSYTKAISLGANNSTLYNDLGVVYENLGIDNQAQASYLKAIQLNPEYLPPYTNLAYFYKQRGDKKQAIYYFGERLKRSKADDPWKTRIEQELYVLNPQIKQDLLEKQAQDLDQELTKKAHDEFTLEIARADKHYQNGQKYFQEKQYDKAQAEFDHALALTPNNPKILNAKEEIKHQQMMEDLNKRMEDASKKINAGDLESAKKELQEILAIIPEPAQK